MTIKTFDPKLMEKYGSPSGHNSVGKTAEKVGHEILEKYERFDYVRESTKKFPGQPFDRLCRKGQDWYIVEIKGARHGFGGSPSRTQKKRMTRVLKAIPELKPGLIQINLEDAQYKARYEKDVLKLIEKKKPSVRPIKPIIDWVKETMYGQSNGVKKLAERF